MTKEQLWQLWCDSDSRQKFAAYEVLTGKQGRPQFPLTEDSAICYYGWHPYEEDSLIRRLHRVAVETKPAYLPDMDITLIAAAGYQLGKADGKREERARKKASERLEAVHADLNNNAMGRSVSL
jgi:hypothetical protein